MSTDDILVEIDDLLEQIINIIECDTDMPDIIEDSYINEWLEKDPNNEQIYDIYTTINDIII